MIEYHKIKLIVYDFNDVMTNNIVYNLAKCSEGGALIIEEPFKGMQYGLNRIINNAIGDMC